MKPNTNSVCLLLNQLNRQYERRPMSLIMLFDFQQKFHSEIKDFPAKKLGSVAVGDSFVHMVPTWSNNLSRLYKRHFTSS